MTCRDFWRQSVLFSLPRSFSFRIMNTLNLLQLWLTFCLFVGTCVNSHPAPSLSALCHGLQPFTKYSYNFHTKTTLNNNDHLGKEPVGFQFQASAEICNVWQNEHNFILLVSKQ